MTAGYFGAGGWGRPTDLSTVSHNVKKTYVHSNNQQTMALTDRNQVGTMPLMTKIIEKHSEWKD